MLISYGYAIVCLSMVLILIHSCTHKFNQA